MDHPKPILALDFDGVLHSYASGWQGTTVINDPPTPGAVPFRLNTEGGEQRRRFLTFQGGHSDSALGEPDGKRLGL